MAVPRPISSSTTNDRSVAWVRMAAVSTISIMKVERPRARSSPAPTRLNRRSTTPRSLVILDEIGRGTATYDGLAIAWACAEALHDTNRCRALFATHYHELATLEDRLAHVSNLSLRAKEWNGELVFLHEAGPGPADRSYGVQVAKLAGVPPAVVARARQVLERLESEGHSPERLEGLPLFAGSTPTPVRIGPGPVEEAVAALEPDGMSPREAMEALYRLKGMLRGG